MALAVAACATLAGCGAASPEVGNRIAGDKLTVYESAPLHGASSVSARAVVAGAQLALDEAHGAVGRYHIAVQVLDDSSAARGEWDPGQTTLNAHAAVQDKTTIAYIGDFNSGASAISIPVLNRAGIAQITPASTAVGLTSDAPGAAPGEPAKYYPAGIPTFVRVVPTDTVQAAAMVKLQLSSGCRKTFVLDDGEFDGEDAATTFELTARPTALQVVAVQSFEPTATDYSSLASSVAQSGADCVLISALTENHAVRLTRQIAAALPEATIFGFAPLAETSFADPTQGGIPTAIDARVLLTSPTLAPRVSGREAQAFWAAYERRGSPVEPTAIFGYEAMKLLLDAISRATDRGRRDAQRSKVIAALFATRGRRGAIGTYSIEPDGDTTLRHYGVYRIVAGRLVFWKAIDG